MISGFATSEGTKNFSEKFITENYNQFQSLHLSNVGIGTYLGEPDFQTNSDEGYRLLFYKNKKFGITCTRRFEIDESGYVIGFVSKGCF